MKAVYLVTSNSRGERERYLGDKLAPGILALVCAGAAALHGFAIGKDSGSIQVESAAPVAVDGYDDPNQVSAMIDLTVRTSVPVSSAIGNVTQATLASQQIQWSFGGATDALTDVITNPGTT